MKEIYLDHNATTHIDPEVLDSMMPYLKGKYGNPSSPHSYGREGREAIENSRMEAARLLGAKKEEIFFTSGGTESINMAIKGAAWVRKGKHIIISSI